VDDAPASGSIAHIHLFRATPQSSDLANLAAAFRAIDEYWLMA
jgi:hypothetical protein